MPLLFMLLVFCSHPEVGVSAASVVTSSDTAVVAAEHPSGGRRRSSNLKTLFNHFFPFTGTFEDLAELVLHHRLLRCIWLWHQILLGHIFAKCPVAPHNQQWGLLPSTMTKILFPLHVSVLGMSRKFFLSRVTCILNSSDGTPALLSAETTSLTSPYKAKKVFGNVQGHTMVILVWQVFMYSF